MEDTQKNLNIQPNESYLSFIKQDIIKQLPNRIEYHLKNNTRQAQTGETTTADEEKIIELLTQEIANGVYLFLNNLPENVKGMKTE
ncbi:spore germination protein GerPC [Neobacillus pocheonensis]|uniref:Spore germination protein GerPC n=1 Tax=Neobacillus pocheonensis TaxID=363869 RepID=A0ABT0WBP1_9BACI|nr:spore germination protein GerPC [Neobacillus pocheonensis]